MPIRSRTARYHAIPDQAYDPRVTDVDHPLNAPPGYGGGAAAGAAPLPAAIAGRTYYNRNVSNQLPVQLVANLSTRILPTNYRRVGLEIQNLDAATPLVYSFGTDRKFRGLVIAAGGAALYDFTTPPDTLYLIASANILVAILEISRQG